MLVLLIQVVIVIGLFEAAITGDPSGLGVDQKYLIVRLHRLGLANRLRSIADWYPLSFIYLLDISGH